MSKSYHTIRGFVDDAEEEDMEPTVSYHATFRAYSETGLDFDAIEGRLAVQPTKRLRRGESAGAHGPTSEGDVWLFRAPVDEREDLSEHLRVMSETLLPHADFIRALGRHASLVLSLGYSSNVDHGGLVIPYRLLEVFTHLELDVTLYIVTCPD